MKNLFRERLKNILDQLTNAQQEELFDKLGSSDKSFEELDDLDVLYLHAEFIILQYSSNPVLQGEDIRNVLIYPYK